MKGEKGQVAITSAEEREMAGLMQKAQSGDRDAYRRLIERMYVMLLSFVQNSFRRFGFSASGGQQEDVVQEILMGIHQKRATFDPTQRFLPWMYAIARYKVIDYFRKNKINLRSTDHMSEEVDSLAAVNSVSFEGEADVEALLAKLPAKQREVLELVKVEELSVAECALKTGYSPSDVKVTVFRAIRALQKLAGRSAR
jgi:RNA polymerase sigma-70 factor, ECF subfamily